ncbi:MAG TPA: TolC family protein, partial [Planctomycetes bacterium]|nr:TolC family protein [Planctomycetota bacterium]
RERKQREYLAALDRQLQAARSNLEEARRRYLHGLNDYLPVLTALSAVQQVQRTMVTAKRELLSYRIQLHRALGGDWTGRLAPPGPPTGKGGGKP